MTENFGEFIIKTTRISRHEVKTIVCLDGNPLCWIKQRGKGIERHIIPEYRNQFREFLRQWRAVNGNKFPFHY